MIVGNFAHVEAEEWPNGTRHTNMRNKRDIKKTFFFSFSHIYRITFTVRIKSHVTKNRTGHRSRYKILLHPLGRPSVLSVYKFDFISYLPVLTDAMSTSYPIVTTIVYFKITGSNAFWFWRSYAYASMNIVYEYKIEKKITIHKKINNEIIAVKCWQ